MYVYQDHRCWWTEPICSMTDGRSWCESCGRLRGLVPEDPHQFGSSPFILRMQVSSTHSLSKQWWGQCDEVGSTSINSSFCRNSMVSIRCPTGSDPHRAVTTPVTFTYIFLLLPSPPRSSIGQVPLGFEEAEWVDWWSSCCGDERRGRFGMRGCGRAMDVEAILGKVTDWRGFGDAFAAEVCSETTTACSR